MAATGARAGEVPGHFVHFYVAMQHLDEKLKRALQPDMQAAQAGRFDDHVLVQIAQRGVFEPGLK